jgi:uncharacterized protein (UPF0332 family)
MNPEDFIAVARVLATGPNQAHWRSAVSRAYYGAFHVAMRFLASLGITFSKTASAHEKVAFCLRAANDGALTEAARKLATLREIRNTADYRLDDRSIASTKLAIVQVGRAEEITAAIAPLEQNPHGVRKAIRNYARSVLKLNVLGQD